MGFMIVDVVIWVVQLGFVWGVIEFIVFMVKDYK